MNTKTRKVLALEATDEKVHDGTMMRKLVKHALSTRYHSEKVKSVLADGAYDSNGSFRFLNDGRIKPVIRVKRNFVVSTKNRQQNQEWRSQKANKRLP